MILIISVHADDGIFSCGEFVARQVADGQDVTVLSLCSVAPKAINWKGEAVGAWQAHLNSEHYDACKHLGAHPLFGPFADGKYDPPRDVLADAESLMLTLAFYDIVLTPMGIHHPDHIHFSRAAFLAVENSQVSPARVAVYEDLPYRVMYPDETAVIREVWKQRFGAELESASNAGFYEKKLEACQMYASQWGDDARRCVMAPERIWWLP